jgi:hypothetical protein
VLQSETQPLTHSSQVVDAYERDGKHFVEVWLIDPTWNKNYWKASQEELTKKIQRFVNKPAILTPYLHHPHEYEHVQENPFDPEGNVRKHQQIDERYRIGHIVRIKPLPNSAYAGVIELTHPGAIAAFQQGKIPRYVSPAVYNLNMTGPMGEFTSFEPLHIAFVDQPAYGLKAKIIDTCHGKEDLCLRNLGVAAVLGESCIMKALDKLENVFEPSSAHSSHMKSNASVGAELSLKEDSATPSVQAAPPVTQEDKAPATVSTENTTKKESKAPAVKKQDTPSIEKEQQPKESTADKKDASSPSEKKEDKKYSLDEVKALIKEEMAEARKAMKEENEKEKALEAKRRLIESYVTLESTNGSKEEQEKRINALMFIPDENLKDFLEQHYKIAGKSRSNAAKASKISDFNRGMPQNAPNNVGTAALILDQETNERIDRVLSMGRFVPSANARIVPNTRNEEVNA